MKNLFDQNIRAELITRVQQLQQDSVPLWGKMNVYQMIKHCVQWEHMILGRTHYKQSFLGKLVGKFALKDMMKDEPAKHNLPTVPSFKITGSGDAEAAKTELINLLTEHDHQTPAGFLHPFFGRLTADQAGKMAYKHLDHHLRQFGV